MLAVALGMALSILRQLLLFGALLVPLERRSPAHPGQRARRPGLALDLTYAAVNPFLIKAGTFALFGLLSALLARLVPGGWRARLMGQPVALQFAEIFLLAEAGGYLLHRLCHEVPWLWRLHAIHHSSEALDWLSAHRQHPLEAVLHLGVANLPVLALGFSFQPVLGFILLQKLYTAFLHANVDIGYGRLSALVASPRFHHFHHEAVERPGNFASTLSLLDWIFGTYRLPPGLPVRYGVDQPVPTSYTGQLLQPFALRAAPAVSEEGADARDRRSSRTARDLPVKGRWRRSRIMRATPKIQ